jgi:hypothetical protein
VDSFVNSSPVDRAVLEKVATLAVEATRNQRDMGNVLTSISNVTSQLSGLAGICAPRVLKLANTSKSRRLRLSYRVIDGQ